MALPAGAIIEVRTTGSDSNGGGFNPARSGTDYSQQDSPQATGTATSSGTTLTATTGIFTSAMKGNYVTNGSQWREIVTFTSSTVVVLDAAPTWTSQSIKVGGGLATINKATALAVAGNTVSVKSGTYTTAAGESFSVNGILMYGYGTTRGDGTRATLQASASIGAVISFASTSEIRNFVIDGNAGNATYAVNFSSGDNTCAARNVKVMGWNSSGFLGGGILLGCEVTTAYATPFGGVNGSFNVFGCYVHDMACTGVLLNNGGTNPYTIQDSIVANCTGASSNGILIADAGAVAIGNTVYSCGQDGIQHSPTGSVGVGSVVRGNLLVSNGRYGIVGSSSIRSDHYENWDYNAFYNNATGLRFGMSAGAHDVTLTGNPLTNAGAGDFSLNNTAGAGAACRAAGWPPGTFPGISTTGYRDIGGVQHADPAGAAGMLYVPNLTGV